MPIMRKDVKLGFAIGGVLLAVLIVYVLVVPGSEKTPPQTKGPAAEAVVAGGGSGSGSTLSAGQTPAPTGANAPTSQRVDPFKDSSKSQQNEAVAQGKSAGDTRWDKLLD